MECDKLALIAGIGIILTALIISIGMVSAIGIGDEENLKLSSKQLFNVSSPIQDGLYVKLKVDFKILGNIGNAEFSKLEYINSNDDNPGWKILCTDCSSFGADEQKKLTMHEGLNEITIRGIDEYGNYSEINISFRVDSVRPKVLAISPRTNADVNGSEFSITYTEMNLRSIDFIYYNNQEKFKITQNCSSGKFQTCSFSPNLSQFEGRNVYFYFVLHDMIDGLTTGTKKIKVDIIPPVLSIVHPDEQQHYFRYVPIKIEVSKKAKVQYLDIFSNIQNWKTLCSDCYKIEKTFIVRGSGVHQFFVKAVDGAGNSDEKNVSFVMD